MDDKKTGSVLINVYAGCSSDGLVVYEELPAIEIDFGVYKLLSTPGLALNMAKGDVIDISIPDKPAKILKRGGNFCIHIYSDEIDFISLKELEDGVKKELNGDLDGSYLGNLSFSVPSLVGMSKIQRFFDKFTEETGIPWYYGNVYKNFEDDNDDTLLDWWL